MSLRLFQHQNIEVLAKKMLEAAFDKKEELFGNKTVFVCENGGMQKWLKMQCANEQGIFMGFEFSDVTSVLLKCAFAITGKYEKRRKFDGENLIWMLYRLLNDTLKNGDENIAALAAYCKNKDNGDLRVFSLAKEIAANFTSYQIYRPEMVDKWNKNEKFETPANANDNWKENEKWQRYIWQKLKKEYANGESDITELYSEMYEKLKHKTEYKNLPKKLLIFATVSMQPVYLKILSCLSNAGCEVEMYYRTVSDEYIGNSVSDKMLARKRKNAQNENFTNENLLYWDLGNRLIANLGKTAQNFYEQILECENIDTIPLQDEHKFASLITTTAVCDSEMTDAKNTLLSKIQTDIISDNNEKCEMEMDNSIQLHSAHSPLREMEILHNNILQMLEQDASLKLGDIFVVAPDIEKYSSAIDIAFNKLKYCIADRDIKKASSTAQLLNMLFSAVGGRYEADETVSLFFYSQFVQGNYIEKNLQEKIKKWVKENAIRFGLNEKADKPNYSWETGIEQLAAGYLIKSGELVGDLYCYPDIEGQDGEILANLAKFIDALKELERSSHDRCNAAQWDEIFSDLFPVFFGEDKSNFNNEDDPPIYQITKLWDSLKDEMKCGFGDDYFENAKIPFDALKFALLDKINENSKGGTLLNGWITFAKFSSLRSIPAKVICCIGMNDREFPNQPKKNEINLLSDWYRLGDKDIANEDRACFLENICCAKKTLYISWVGQSEEDNSELNPSSSVLAFLKNLEKQYGIKKDDCVVKHPLQPFSKKYFHNKNFEIANQASQNNMVTFDERWSNKNKLLYKKNIGERNIFKWEIEKQDENYDEIDIADVRKIYNILSNAPKYFLEKTCNIDLPQDAENLENREKFVIENKLEEWKIKDLAISRIAEKNEIAEITKIQMMRGELPTGVYAERLIKEKIDEVKDMVGEYEDCEWKKCEFGYYINTDIPTFVKASSDKGKYRLWHYLVHLSMNLKQKTRTRIILKKSNSAKEKNTYMKLTLSEMTQEIVKEEIEKLYDLTQKLKKQMLPIFPDAAWEYATEIATQSDNSSIIKSALKKTWKNLTENNYDVYAKYILGNAESFADLEIEHKFMETCDVLFENYKKILEKSE